MFPRFLASVASEKRREDAGVVLEMMKKITGLEPAMWGSSLIGFGTYHYKYDSGREGDSFRLGLSPRKANLVIYIIPGFKDYQAYLDRLGKCKTGHASQVPACVVTSDHLRQHLGITANRNRLTRDRPRPH